MNYKQTLAMITSDERFASFQNFDPELLENLEYFHELPSNVTKFCFSLNEEGGEPYFEEVVSYVKSYAEIEELIGEFV